MREELIWTLGTLLKFTVKVPFKALEIISKVISKTYRIIN